MVMMVMMMVMVCSGHVLSLRRDRSRQAEDEGECNQELFHMRIDASF
jgi:hypothetical protein